VAAARRPVEFVKLFTVLSNFVAGVHGQICSFVRLTELGPYSFPTLMDQLDPPSKLDDSGAGHGVRPESAPPVDGALDAASTDDVEPFNLQLLGKLFGVPLLIISIMVGGAVTVVFLFGGPAAPQHRSADELLSALEATSGAKSIGILLPREKELWQTALELTQRLEHKEAEFSDEELDTIAARLGALALADLAHRNTISSFGKERDQQAQVRTTRLEFVLRALGRTGRQAAIEPLLEVVQSGWQPFSRVAVAAIGDLESLPETAACVDPVLAAMERADSPEALLTCATVLSVIARRGDETVIKQLDHVRLTHDGEVEWAAALALARLGSGAGKSTLMDMLDRHFWESGKRYQKRDASGTIHRYPMPPQRVDELLIASAVAVSNTDDADLWESIQKLKSDRSSVVRGRVGKLVKRRESP